MPLKVAVSVCPNDIYVYSALILNEIPHSYQFSLLPLDKLNHLALNQEADFIKISAGFFQKICGHYSLCQVGASFGHSGGPKIVIPRKQIFKPNQAFTLASPSLDSTASLIARIAFPQSLQIEMDLRHIPKAVAEGVCSAGIVINEAMGDLNRFGLQVHQDLAVFWRQHTGRPLPLGVVVASNRINLLQRKKFEEDVRASFLWARAHHQLAVKLAVEWSAEKDIDLIESHIDRFSSTAAEAPSLLDAIRELRKNPMGDSAI